MPKPNKKKSQRKKRSHVIKKRAGAKTVSDANARVAAGLHLQQRGELEEAKNEYIAVLKSHPQHADAWHFLGMAMYGSGQLGEAFDCLDHAIRFAPENHEVLSNAGLLYREKGELEKARELLDQAANIASNSATIQNNLGAVCLEQGDLDTAESHLEKAVQLDPHFVNAAMNLGNLWQRRGRLMDAEKIYRDALNQQPNQIQILTNLAESLRKQCKWDQAIQILQQILQATPENKDATIQMARCLTMQQQCGDARNILEKLLLAEPHFAKAHHYMAHTYFDEGDMERAHFYIKRAMELEPTDPYALSSAGKIVLEMGDVETAEQYFRRAIEIDPLMSECHSFLLFILSGKADFPQDALYAEHLKWGQIHGSVSRTTKHMNVADENKRLRVGYVSPDFRKHAVTMFLLPVLKHHNGNKIEVFCYGELKSEDQVTEEVKAICDHWRPTIGLSDEQLATQIREDQIDVLVDLAGHTAGNRLLTFARRPAPVQVTWMGYPNTTGLAAIDYRLTCAVQNPANEPSYHSEELVRMPSGSYRFTPPQKAPKVNDLPALRNEFITFGSLHRPLKISESARDLWANVMRVHATSRLVVFNTRFTNESSEELLSGLERRGVARERVEVRRKISGEHYLEAYRDIDIGLDVTPWAGGTTTLEALWMGVPVIAYYGDRRSARSTASIVNVAGFPGWIATSNDEYVDRVSELTNQLMELSKIRKSLRSHVEQTVVNAGPFTRELENEFRRMWTRWCQMQTKSALI